MTTPTYLTFDTETTGLDTAKDQIIEISILTGLGKDAVVKTRRLKPTIPISSESTSIHGISDDDVKDCPTFRQIGKGLREMFEGADIIVGYNVSFDLQILQSELQRNGFEQIPLQEKHIVDPLGIWKRLRPRKLGDAYKKFCGKELVNAHSAEADVIATAEVFEGMLGAFDLEKLSPLELAALSTPSDWIGISHQIRWRDDVPTFSFGKEKGKPVWECLQRNPSYVEWMKKASFLPHVLEICESAVSMQKDDFLGWVREKYPQRVGSETAKAVNDR